MRPWPSRVVEIHSTKHDNPYEGYWLIAVPISDYTTQTALQPALSSWNDTVIGDGRYLSSTMFVRAELISQQIMLQQELKEDHRKWPRPLAKPDPRYTQNRVTKDLSGPVPSTSAGPSQPSRKLRPAMDILSRLKYDPALDLDDYVVGYIDRHSGIQEKAAGAWIGESTHEEWIPQGRIQYFKRVSDGTLVWDRTTKTDLVFK